MRARKIGKVLLYVLAGFAGLGVVLLLAVKLALDRVPAYQSEIKPWVYRQTGLNIAFAHVSPSLRWYGPELYFDRLELRSKDDRRVLARAAGGRIGADVWQLLRSGKLFAGRVELVAPDISITRLGKHSFALGAELELNGPGSNEPLTLDDLPAGTIAIHGGRITVQNWNESLPQLLLGDVNLVLRREADAVKLQLDARLPAALGGALHVAGGAQGLADAESLDWRVDARAADVAFAGWRLLLPEYLSNLDAGGGNFEVNVAGRGANLSSAALDFTAHAVATRLPDGSTAKFELISGLVTLTHGADRWSVAGRRVRAVQAGRKDPASEFDVGWRTADSGLLELRARASYLRADSLLPLAGLVPEKDIRDRLLEAAPTGEWLNAQVELTRPAVTDPWAMHVQARFRDAGFAAVGRAPGLRGLSGTIAGTDSGGHVMLDADNVLVSWPRQWPQPVGLDRFKGTLYWSRNAERLLIASPALDLHNPDAELHAQLGLQLPAGGGSPWLALAARVANGNVANTRFYLPREVLHEKTLEWLDRAFVAGRLVQANVALQGPLWQFPFRDGSGRFAAHAELDGLILDYGEGWPLLEKLSGEAEFRNEGLTVHVGAGGTGGIKIESAEARFADFKSGELEVHGGGGGDAADVLKFLRASPLDGTTDGAFSSVEARGPLRGKVDLFLPLQDFEHRRVLVQAQFAGVTLTKPGLPLTASELDGSVEIDGGHVSRADLHGRLLDGPVRVTAKAGRRRPLTRTQLDLRGTLNGDALRAALGLPANAAMGGTADWRGVVVMAQAPSRERSLHVTAGLAGLDSRLPEPLAKAPGRPLPSWLDMQWPEGKGALLNVGVGGIVRAVFEYEPAGGARLAHAAVAFGGAEPAFSDAQQVNVTGRIERLNLDGWLALYAPDKDGKPLADYLRSAKLDVGEVDFLGLAFHKVSAELSAGAERVRLTCDGPNVAGTITMPVGAEAVQPWELQFERLRADDVAAPAADAAGAPSAGAAVEPAPPAASSVSPRSVPAINFHAAELSWGDRHFGNVQANLTKVADGVVLEHLTANSATFNIKAQGEWRGKDAGQGRISGTLASTDVRTTLAQLGYADVIEARTGRLDFDLNWLGAPTGDSLRDTVGHVRIALERGQVLGIKPGAGRILGLASIAELPRRLALDFSDLTDKGLAFDTVHGDFDLRGGDAYTDNVLLKGPAAEIGLIGRVGLKNKDYDQTAVVTGSVGNSLPLAAFAGGPVVGAAVLLFTQVFKQPLRGLARGYYRISGPWDNPTVERIKSAEAAAAGAEGGK